MSTCAALNCPLARLALLISSPAAGEAKREEVYENIRTGLGDDFEYSVKKVASTGIYDL